MTPRYPYEVRNEADYFDDIPDEKIPKDMLDLGSHIVTTNFDPDKFVGPMMGCSEKERALGEAGGQLTRASTAVALRVRGGMGAGGQP